jgi:RNA polymerase sigma-70 factor (ECF subfamily)
MAEIPATRASLLVRLRDSRDEAAWTQFLELYAPLVYGYARKAGLQDADAEDLAQGVFVAVAGAVGRLKYDPRRGSFRNWLFTIVRHKLSHWHAARKIRCQGSGDSAIQQLLETFPSPGGEDEWQAECQDRLFSWACEQVRRDVTEATWQAFWRTAVAGQPSKQVAGDLGVTVATVYVSRSRVLARLKELVQSAQEL